MLYVGLDVHKKKTTIAVLDSKTGEVMRARTIPTSELVAHVAALERPLRVALEDGSGSGFLARQLISCDIDTVVVDSFKLSRLRESCHSAKTDRLDATTMASLLSRGLLEELQTWVPDERTAQLRELCRARDQRVAEATACCNYIRKFLTQHDLTCPSSDLSGKAAGVWLDAAGANLEPNSAFVLASHRRTLSVLTEEADALAKRLAELTADDADTQLLRTVPGCGAILAPAIAAQIGQISRFQSATRLRGYAGLCPRVIQSGERARTGPLPKTGNPHLRRAMVLLAQHVTMRSDLRHTSAMKQYYRVLHKHGPNPAKVALARRLLTIIFVMLRDREPFDPARLAA